MSSDLDIIYHYCSLDAFVNIVKSKSIWLTNIFYMNDSEEHYWLRKKAREAAEREKKAAEEGTGKRIDRFIRMLFPDKETTRIYCTCFSMDGDSLSQWRAYADDGRGVAIGFSRNVLEESAAEYKGLALREVLYDEREQEMLIDGIVKKARENNFRNYASPGTMLYDLRFPFSMVGGLLDRARMWEEAARCKNPAFTDEKEVRLIYMPGSADTAHHLSDLLVRARSGLLVPYYFLALKPNSIIKVCFGPKSEYALNKPVTEEFLTDNGFIGIAKDGIVKSTASYR